MTLVKEKTDLRDVVSDYTTLEVAGEHIWKGRCVFPERHASKDSDPSLVVYDDGSFYCYGCGAGSKDEGSLGNDCIAFIRMVDGLTFNEAIERLAQRAGLDVPSCAASQQSSEKGWRISRNLEMNRQFFSNLKVDGMAMAYLKCRGITDDDILQWRLGSVPYDYEYKDLRSRVAYPIFDERGVAVGFGYRSIDGTEPKYINSPTSSVFNKGSLLYGLNFARKSILQKSKVVVTEGYMDVISAHRCGACHVVGVMGTGFTDAQAKLLRKYTDEIVFAFDGDTPGQTKTTKHIERARASGFVVKVIRVEPGLDLDDLSRLYPGSLSSWLDEREVTPEQWALDTIIGTYHSDVSVIRERTYKKFKEHLVSVHDPLYLAEAIERFSQELGIPSLKLLEATLSDKICN